MANIKTPKWKSPLYTKSEITKAGKIIGGKTSTQSEFEHSLEVLENWRASHAYPLHVFFIHLRRMAKDKDNTIVAQRLKRFDSILGKLKRFPDMNLWRMQDLGGCRVIAPSNLDVYDFSNLYVNSRIRHKLKKSYDYIDSPKESGYRSLHLVFEYKSDNKESAYNNNMLVEIQFRTHLQHMWATAVETMGIYINQSLKSGAGDEDVKRFFALISSLFALEENSSLVPNTPLDKDELIHEIESLNSRHNYLDILSAIKVAVNNQNKSNPFNKDGFYLLILNLETHLLKIFHYLPSNIEEANTQYDQIEQSKGNQKIDVVLVRVDSFKTLKNAYPNYFSDITSFIDKVKSYLN